MAWQDVINSIVHGGGNGNKKQHQNFLDALLSGARNAADTVVPGARIVDNVVSKGADLAGRAVNDIRENRAPTSIVDNPIYQKLAEFSNNVADPSLSAATRGVATLPSDLASSVLQVGDLLHGGKEEDAIKQRQAETTAGINDFLTNTAGIKNYDPKTNLAAKLGGYVAPLISNVLGVVSGGDAAQGIGALTKAGFGVKSLDALGDVAKLNPSLAQSLIHTVVNPETTNVAARLTRLGAEAAAGGTAAAATTGGLEGQDPKQIAKSAAINTGLGVAGEVIGVAGKAGLKKLADLHDALKADGASGAVLDHIQAVINNEGGFIKLPGKGESKVGQATNDVPGAATTPEELVAGSNPQHPTLSGAQPNNAIPRAEGQAPPLIRRPDGIQPRSDIPQAGDQPLLVKPGQAQPDISVQPPAPAGGAEIPQVAPDGTPAPGAAPAAPEAADLQGGGASIPKTAPDGTPAPEPIQGGGAPAVEGAAGRLRARMQTGEEIQAENKAAQPKVPFLQKVDEAFDKFAPLKGLASAVKKTTGEELDTSENPHDLLQLTNGMTDAVKQRTSAVIKSLGDLKGTVGVTGKTLLDDAKTLGIARQIGDRAEQYPSDLVQEAKAAEQELQQKLAPGDFAKVEGAVKQVSDFHDGQLKRLVSSKIISPEAYAGIKEANPNYFSKFNLTEFINDNKDLFASNNSKNVRDAVVKAVKGLDQGDRFKILDPVTSMVQSAFSTEKAVQNNNIFHSIRNLAEKIPDTVKIIRSKEDVQARFDLAKNNQELRGVNNKIDRVIKTSSATVRRLQTASSQLEKKAYQLTLKKGGRSMVSDFLPSGLGGDVPTSQVGDKVMGRTPGEQALLDAVSPTNLKLGPKDTRSFLNSLVEGPISEVEKLKKMVGNRDSKASDLLDHIGDLKNEYDARVGEIKANMAAGKDLADKEVPKGFETIVGQNNGVTEKIAVPTPMARAYTGKNDIQKGQLDKIFRAVGKPLRTAVTSLSVPFQLVGNPIRDASTAPFVSKYIPKKDTAFMGTYIFKHWLPGFWSAVTDDKAAQDVALNGGGSAGIFGEHRTADEVTKDLARKVNGRQVTSLKEFAAEAGHILGTPIRGLQTVGRAIEYAPRLAEAKAAIKSGASPEAAALGARNATADLQNGGPLSRTLDTFMTFFNARAQGNYNVVKSIKRDPARAGVAIAANVAVPILAAYAWNHSRYPDVLDQMSQTDRDNNFILVLGDHKDKNGKFTQVITIPKNEPEQFFGNAIESGLRAMGKDHPESLEKVLGTALGYASTVQFMKDGKPNFSRLLSSTALNSPAVAVPAELASNHNFYNDSDIVPQSLAALPDSEQVRPDTPEIAKILAKLTGGSPLKAQAAIQGTTGSLATSDPVTSLTNSLTGSQSSNVTTKFYDILDNTSKLRASASKRIDDQLAAGDYQGATATAQAYNSALSNQFRPFARQYKQYITPDMEKSFAEQPITLNSRTIKQRRKAGLQAAQ